MPRRTHTERDRAYRRRMEREADEKFALLEEELHREWAEQHPTSGRAKRKRRRSGRRRAQQAERSTTTARS